jgi:hypothetical protein
LVVFFCTSFVVTASDMSKAALTRLSPRPSSPSGFQPPKQFRHPLFRPHCLQSRRQLSRRAPKLATCSAGWASLGRSFFAAAGLGQQHHGT